ncbi:hypothetical protein [Frankia sp. CiP3]|uniref:hypothetical protein n=1 Tax=Frankia sp. CiP3 TaxID=2880971 RepID=UPI001EF4EB73|nr:hypothetical protein [Frankia sp. CiP3]
MTAREFVQNIVLLGLSALLAGLVIPYVLKIVDFRRERARAEYESRSARQARVLDSQADFLEEISRKLWDWRYLCMKVTYYGAGDLDDEYRAAVREYDAGIWVELNAVRNLVSRSRRLSSNHCYQVLIDFYERYMVRLDNDLRDARGVEEKLLRRAAYIELNRFIFSETTIRIDEILDSLAEELGLKG